MALRSKTIEVPFETRITGLTAATRFDFSAVTVYIPEVTSRTFKSVYVVVTLSDNYTVAATMTSYLLGIKLGAAAFSDNTVTDTLTGIGGEHQTWDFARDVTAYFNTNFGAGSSQTAQVGVQFGGVATNNITAKLVITYEFDNAAQTIRSKTVKIPLESNLAFLGTSLGSIGTNQVPALDTFLPEASKTYRHIWFEIMGNCNSNSTADYQLSYALDSELASARALKTNNLNSGIWYNDIWVRTGTMTTSSAHDFKAMCNVANRFYALSVLLCVTYEYDHDASTSIINSLEMQAAKTSGRFTTSVGDQSKEVANLLINEPGPISLVQSAVIGSFAMVAPTTLEFSVGSQGYRAYVYSIAIAVCGQSNFNQRVDSGSSMGAAFSLSRGVNQLFSQFYASVVTAGFLHARFILNYTSGKSDFGADAHNKTRRFILAQSADFQDNRIFPAAAPTVSSTNYFLSSIAIFNNIYIGISGAVVLFTENLAGEWQNGGWVIISGALIQKDGPNGVYYMNSEGTRLFKQFPLDPRPTVVNIFTPRRYRIDATGDTLEDLIAMLVSTSIYFESEIQLVGYSGTGSGIEVDVFRVSDDFRVFTGSTAAGGTVNAIWYDDTYQVYAVARQGSTRLGRSDNFTIGSDVTINLLAATSPGITFAGISSLSALANGALRASWAAASGGTAPLRYEVYIQAATAVGLFSDANLAYFPDDTTIDIFQLANGDYLELGVTYFVGVRACDYYSCDSNIVSASAVSLGVLPQSLEETANLLKRGIEDLNNIRIATATDMETSLVEVNLEADLIEGDLEADLMAVDMEAEVISADIETDLVQADMETDLVETNLEIDSMESDFTVGC